jgi:Ricin-type beta-trefoil lectin domain
VQNGSPITTYDCDSGTNYQRWDTSVGDVNQAGLEKGYIVKRAGSNYCLDAYNPQSGTTAYGWECTPTVQNHNWLYDWDSKLLRQAGTTQCLAKYQPSNNTSVNTWTCNTNDPNLKWDAIRVY